MRDQRAVASVFLGRGSLRSGVCGAGWAAGEVLTERGSQVLVRKIRRAEVVGLALGSSTRSSATNTAVDSGAPSRTHHTLGDWVWLVIQKRAGTMIVPITMSSGVR